MKTNKVLIIVLSNFSITECFRNVCREDMNIVEPLFERFHQIDFQKFRK
jgi:hypothetical protein